MKRSVLLAALLLVTTACSGAIDPTAVDGSSARVGLMDPSVDASTTGPDDGDAGVYGDPSSVDASTSDPDASPPCDCGRDGGRGGRRDGGGGGGGRGDAGVFADGGPSTDASVPYPDAGP